MELHRGLVETHHPGAVVKWDSLKTRGDSLCRFRFYIPELVTDDEQGFVLGDPLLTPHNARVEFRGRSSMSVPTAERRP